MVGEIRDSASADTAVKASETGHMLMSTIHALDTVSTISRLEGMGVNREQIAGVLSAVLAQRLVKSIPDGSEFDWVAPSDIEMEWLKRNGIYFEGILFPKIKKSLMTERIPLMELIEVTSEIREVIAKSGDRTIELLNLIAKQPQFETLAQCGVKLAMAGKTTLAEVMSVTRDNISLQTPKRFEQILIERGWLSVNHLNQAWKIYIENQVQGVIYPLEKILLDYQFVSQELLFEARALAQKDRIVQDISEVSRKKLVVSTSKNVAA
jgi:general secretion pathway protein E